MNIAITGEGIISAIGTDKNSVLQALLEGRSGVGPMRYLPSVHTELPVGEVPCSDNEMKQRLGISVDETISRTTLMGIWAVGQSLAEARIDEKSGLRIWLLSGTTVGGMDVTESHFAQISQQHGTGYFKGHDCGSCTDAIARYFGVFDETGTVSTACSSAANSIMLGARLLRAGLADVVVAGGSEALSRFHLNGFNSLMILDHERCRPFDATRAGLNLGEGAAYVVLEPEQQALKRGADIHAYLTGWGNACDAYHQTASSPDGEGATLAMQQALQTAGLKADNISYINAHGTGTPNNDQCESAALQRVFAGCAMPPVSSTKAFTGHATSAAGSIESVICLLAMQRSFIPQSLGYGQPSEGCIMPSAGERNVKLSHVMCNSFGFGGNDTALIFSSEPTTANEAPLPYSDADIKEVAHVTLTLPDELKAISQYVKPLEARRMGRIMKASLLASLQALETANIDVPDAIITATAYGCTVNSEKILMQMQNEGEANVSPTLFMQSTHNTIGSNVAIRTHCHGYNTTYTQGNRSLDWAMRDARMLLRSGKCKSVLVGCHDEMTPLLCELLGDDAPFNTEFESTAIVLTCGV